MTIKEIRNYYGLTQAQFAEITGIPVRTIENWEMGVREPASYIPALVKAAIELRIIQEGGDTMGEFNIGLAKCNLKEYVGGVEAEYINYLRNQGISFDDQSSPLVADLNALYAIEKSIYKCKTEADITKLRNQAAELRTKIQ